MLSKTIIPSLLTLLVFLQSAWAIPITYEDLANVKNAEDLAELEKRQSSFQLVTGAGSGADFSRLEMRDLQANRPDQWNLYLLGLRRFMQTDQSNKLSYYNIAGIHGRPYRSWDNVAIQRSAGYCTHVSPLFLTWHRPYMALFEQVLYQNIQAVVQTFPTSTRQRWANAANGFRMPYWDWAVSSGGQTAPQSMRSQFVTVTTPSGQQSIANPLFSYTFHPLVASDMAFSPYTIWGNTKRHPNGSGANAGSDNTAFANAANNQRVGLRDRVYNLMTGGATFNSVATEATGGGSGNPTSHDSFESVHDAVHVLTGGTSGGHMYYVDFSSFDPAFWLHHTNVDRLFALWQALYPNKYLTPGAQQQNNAWVARGVTVNANTDLKPFHRTQSTYWTSNSIRNTRTFNYFYPETGAGFTAASVRAAVNRLYGQGAGVSKRDAMPYIHERGIVNGTYNSTLPTNSSAYNLEYSINVQVPKYTIEGSYVIYFFLGDFNDNPLTYPTDPALAGVEAVFNPVYTPESVDDVITSCKLPLSSYIQQRWVAGDLSSLDYDSVNEYLKTALQWRIVKSDGTLVPVDSVSGLLVSVSSSKVKPADSYDQFPSYVPGSTNYHAPITHGKPGGYSGNMPPPGSYSNGHYSAAPAASSVAYYSYAASATSYGAKPTDGSCYKKA